MGALRVLLRPAPSGSSCQASGSMSLLAVCWPVDWHSELLSPDNGQADGREMPICPSALCLLQDQVLLHRLVSNQTPSPTRMQVGRFVFLGSLCLPVP